MNELTINDRISKLIESENLTPNSFANRLGVKATIIYNIQKGRNKPSFDMLIKIIDTFQVDANWLLTGKDEIKPTVASNDVGERHNVSPNRSHNSKANRDYLRALFKKSRANSADPLDDYYTNDPIGIYAKHFQELKAKHQRKLVGELIKENENLFDLSLQVDNLDDLIEVILDTYREHINNRPDPYEVAQYFDLEKDTINIPDTIDYNEYKRSVMNWLSGIKDLQPLIATYHRQSQAFLEAITKANLGK